ncbi:phosphoglycerate kinase [Mycobacterium sp. KBS0706]|uniref:phosphoglycerate kinase n=1 Tax=Mycobacterium sp. KBS0706 TaxID=2578109 RepID=UPI00110FE33A|nr:phosphoglycerate kinase [Mycobacterium sp. KBS0706]TSD89267.1 phosphoglycerate kinase [Mycobacterium sp. KBS0706]
MSAFKTLDDVDVRGKTVLVRGDLNVPVEDGHVSDTTRLDRLAPTIDEIADKGGRVVLLSHFGRPKGVTPEFSLKTIVLPALEEVLERPVAFAEDCVGPKAEAAVKALKDGQILLLENVRFHPEEEKNDPAFAKALAALGDLYVNDAFSAAHRAHASTEGIAHHLPAIAGRLMQAELEALSAALEAPKRPVLAIVGGAKISTKLDLLGNLVAKVDRLVLGGGMANTFLAAQGVDVGKSLCEHDMADAVHAILGKAEAAGCEIVLPVDGVVAREFKADAPHQAVDNSAIPADAMLLDIGPKSVANLKALLAETKTVVWNGPLGVFEKRPFDAGTVAVARAAADLTKAGKLLTVAGGGDTVAALAHAGVENRFSYISTAGGAFLEWLEGKDLPGVAALKR